MKLRKTIRTATLSHFIRNFLAFNLGNMITKDLNHFGEHTLVTEGHTFPYMAAVLKENKFLTNGALVNEKWVLTAANGLTVVGDTVRFLRVRLGSINSKRGGILCPVKQLQIHPYFNRTLPNWDLALVMLADAVHFTATLKPIRLQMTPIEVTATHFIVTSWPSPLEIQIMRSRQSKHMEFLEQQRMLTVTHLHPLDAEECVEDLKEIEVEKDALMCLDPAANDPCLRNVGAPVVLNNYLWGVISSWKSEECSGSSADPVYVTLMSAENVSSWIHATLHDHRWTPGNE